jgi:pantetheine-phosphate adenylyltransferase
MKKCVYAGSFDPPTNGHLWMIREGAKLFDELVVSIGINPQKEYTFSVEERLAMLHEITHDLKNVRIESFENKFLADYSREIGANFVLRGLRDRQDYHSEHFWRQRNNELNPSLLTVFVIPPKELEEISSSFVKGLVGPEGWPFAVRKFVPEEVHSAILRKFSDSK